MSEPKSWPRKVERWQTSDGDTHPSETSAQAWQRQIQAAHVANQCLESGLSLIDALSNFRERAGWPGTAITDEERDALAGVTSRSMFVISHWQCRDQAGYSPVRFQADGCIFVHGDAGSWSGSYGNWCTVREVSSYAKQTRERCKGVVPERAP